MTPKQLKDRIIDLHNRESELSHLNSDCDKIILEQNKKKTKIAKQVSKSVKYRNLLINQLYNKNK